MPDTPPRRPPPRSLDLGLALTCALTLACGRPAPPPRPTTTSPPPPVLPLACPGGLVCEAAVAVDGWRVPSGCHARALTPSTRECLLEGVDWERLGEFLRSRYPHAVLGPKFIRVSGQEPPLAAPNQLLAPPPPLLIAVRRANDVEMRFLAGAQVDTPPVPKETGPAILPSPRSPP